METWQRAELAVPNHTVHPHPSRAQRNRRVAWVDAGFLLCLAVLTAAATLPNDDVLRPHPVDWSRAHQTSLDLSRFLDVPAGRQGFLRVRGRHIVRPDGARFRFWGVNLCGSDCFPSATEAEQLAGDLARLGVNIVRFHHLDSTWGRSIFVDEAETTRRLSDGNLDRLDYLVAQLKHRGIYANLNLNVLRKYRAGDNVRDFEALGIGKAATYFNPRLIDLQHEYARQLLTHRNPYTGNEYRHEPAVAVVEVLNENSLLEAWVQGRLIGHDDPSGATWASIPVSYAEELTALYNTWLSSTLAPSDLDVLRNESQAGPGGPVSRLVPAEFRGASRERFQTEARFYQHLEHRFFEGMKQLLRVDLGVKSLLVGTADHNDTFSGFAHLQANLEFDIVDAHGYWQHPNLEGDTWIRNTPMVNDPLDSTVVQFARTPVVDRPFTISEVNHPFPHAYAGEGFVILTAYALFHDWDGLTWFTWGHGRLTDPAEGIPKHGWFDLTHDPAKLTSLTACGLMWHRQDVQRARRTIVRTYTPERLLESLRADPARERPFFLERFALSTPLQHATRFSFGDRNPHRFPPAAPLDTIVSDTGQLGWHHADRERGVVTIDTPRTQALVGFVRNSDRSTRNLAADVTNEFCSLTLTTLDDRSLVRSRRMLLTAVARTSNTDFEWKEDGQTVARWGQGPVLIEPVMGVIHLRGLKAAGALRVHPLAANGTPLALTIEASKTGDTWSIPIGEPVALSYRIEVSR